MPVLVGFVPTPEGRAALRRAILECRGRDARLVVVRSEPVAGGRDAGPERADGGDSTAEEIGRACADLDVARPEVDVRRMDLHRPDDAYEAADHVLSVADETSAELIVIGLRRRSAVGKLILGGSAQRILLDAHCPVLAVKAVPDADPSLAADADVPVAASGGAAGGSGDDPASASSRPVRVTPWA